MNAGTYLTSSICKRTKYRQIFKRIESIVFFSLA